MLTVPKGVQPIKIISNKIETKEQLIVPKGVEPIKSEKKEKTQTPQPKNNNCVGWNKPGCFSESIKRVQACLNVGVSGNFDDTLKNVLASLPSTYAYKDGFNDSDVEKICKLKQDADKQDLQNKEQAARIAQKKMEMDMFSKQYPKATTKATKTDQF